MRGSAAGNNPGSREELRALTVAQSCAVLHVCRKTLAGLIRDRRIRAVRIGRAVRIPEASLVRFLQGNK